MEALSLTSPTSHWVLYRSPCHFFSFFAWIALTCVQLLLHKHKETKNKRAGWAKPNRHVYFNTEKSVLVAAEVSLDDLGVVQ